MCGRGVVKVQPGQLVRKIYTQSTRYTTDLDVQRGYAMTVFATGRGANRCRPCCCAILVVTLSYFAHVPKN